MKVCLIIAVAGFFILAAIAQDYTVSVTTVAVWVKAIDKDGRPVTGLASDDFSILEDNRKMPISCFEELNAGTTQTQPDEIAQQKRKLILTLDLYNTTHTEFLSIREEIENFVDKLDPEVWKVMLAAIVASNPTEVVPFTDEYERIHNEIQSMEGNTFRDQEIAKRKKEISDMVRYNVPGRGRSKAYQVAQFYAQEEKQLAEQTLKGLSALGKYLEDAEDHAIIVFISGGFNTRPGLQYYQILDKAEQQKDFDADMTAFRSTNIMDRIEQRIGALQQKNVTIYCVNTRGTSNPGLDHLREESFTFNVSDPAFLSYYQQGMDEIAGLSGGLSFKNTNDFERPFSTILADTTNHYILCYKPSHENGKEKYRKIQVKINKPQITLRHRKGYWSE